MGDPYASCPVDRTNREFRLLNIHPSNGEDIIKCDMRTYRFGLKRVVEETLLAAPADSGIKARSRPMFECRHPPYTALSYTWGADIAHTDIEINSAKVPIRENLWDFLHQQQLRGNYGPFWIDALCIQQSEVYERNHQVQMMGSIYTTARLVLIWLGKDSDDSDLAMRALADWEWCHQSTIRYMFTNKVKISDTLLAVGTKGITTWNSKKRLAVLSLCSRRYWSRMWIIQEVKLASRVEIHCGSEILEWYKLEQLCYYHNIISKFHQEMDTPFHSAVRTSPAMSIAKIRGLSSKELRHLCWPHRVTIDLLMKTYGDHECEDIRDKVYALVGLAEQGDMIVVDYHKPAKDVLLDVFYHVSNHYSIDVYPNDAALLKFGHLLEKVLKVPFSKAEMWFHIDRSNNMRSEHRLSRSGKGYFDVVIPPQKDT